MHAACICVRLCNDHMHICGTKIPKYACAAISCIPKLMNLSLQSSSSHIARSHIFTYNHSHTHTRAHTHTLIHTRTLIHT